MLSRNSQCSDTDCTYMALPYKGISAIAEGTFDGMINLQTLDLTGNQLVALPSNVFKDLKNLAQLRLEYNRIENINQGAFEGLTSLTNLNLGGNRLSAISDNTFQGLGASLEYLEMSSNMLTSISSKAFRSMSGLKYISLHNNQLAMLPKDLFYTVSSAQLNVLGWGNPLVCVPDKMNPRQYPMAHGPVSLLPPCPPEVSVPGLSLMNTYVLTRWWCVQGGLCPSCAFAVDMSGMLSQTHDPACNVTSCTFLALSNKGIASIAEGTFNGMANLQSLVLNGNRLVSLSDHVFSYLVSLEQLLVGRNSITNISQGAFSSLSSLTSLSLDNNQLASLEAGVFVGLTSLKSLVLSGNRLSMISDNTFQGLGASLNSLLLDYNRLTFISSKAFKSMSGLTSMGLSNNQLVMLPKDVFSAVESTMLHVESFNNPLVCVPDRMSSAWQDELRCPHEVSVPSLHAHTIVKLMESYRHLRRNAYSLDVVCPGRFMPVMRLLCGHVRHAVTNS